MAWAFFFIRKALVILKVLVNFVDMTKKTIIHEFDPCVYPRLLWVVKGGSLDEIRKTLEFDDIGEDFQSTGGAITIAAYNNEKKKGGFLVWFPKAIDMTNNSYWLAHEATHVAMGIFDYVGAEVEYSNSEPFAYLVGWAFKCMEEVRKFKEVKYGDRSIESKSSNAEKSQSQTPREETQENR